MYQKIIVCIDNTPLSEEVVQAGADLAQRYKASIVLLSVVDPDSFARQPFTGLEAIHMVDRHSRTLSNNLHRLGGQLKGIGIETTEMILNGRSADTILNVAQNESADLIIIGGESRNWFQAWLNNDLCSEVASNATCNVLRVTASEREKKQKGTPVPARQEARPSFLATSISAL